jgi:hypothetical protein
MAPVNSDPPTRSPGFGDERRRWSFGQFLLDVGLRRRRVGNQYIGKRAQQEAARDRVAQPAVAAGAEGAEHVNPPGGLLNDQVVLSAEAFQRPRFEFVERARVKPLQFLEIRQGFGHIRHRRFVLEEADPFQSKNLPLGRRVFDYVTIAV